MAKYYVSSGDVNEIVMEDSPLDAASKVLTQNNDLEEPKDLGLICKVSEKGFNIEDDYKLCHGDDVYIATDNILRECGIPVDYTLEDVVEELSNGLNLDDIDDIEETEEDD